MFSSKRDVDVKTRPDLVKYRNANVDMFNAHYKPIHLSYCGYYDDGWMSEKQIMGWCKIVMVAEKKYRKKMAAEVKRII